MEALKGAMKLYFTHYYSCVAIILFNTGLCRFAFSTILSRKLAFRLSVLSVLFISNRMFRFKALTYVLSLFKMC